MLDKFKPLNSGLKGKATTTALPQYQNVLEPSSSSHRLQINEQFAENLLTKTHVSIFLDETKRYSHNLKNIEMLRRYLVNCNLEMKFVSYCQMFSPLFVLYYVR